MAGGGKRKVIHKAILAVTIMRRGWFMGRDIVADVEEMADRKYHPIAVGKGLSKLLGEGFFERRKISKRGSDYGSYKYRRLFGKT